MFIVVYAPEGLYVVFFLQTDEGLYQLCKVFCINSIGCRPDGKPARLPLERPSVLPKHEIFRVLREYCGTDGHCYGPAGFGHVWVLSKREDAWHNGGATLRNLLRAMGLAPKEAVREEEAR